MVRTARGRPRVVRASRHARSTTSARATESGMLARRRARGPSRGGTARDHRSRVGPAHAPTAWRSAPPRHRSRTTTWTPQRPTRRAGVGPGRGRARAPRHERRRPRTGAGAGVDALALPAHRRVRVPVGLPHGRADRAGRVRRLAVRAPLRRAEHLREPARPPGRVLPRGAVRDQPPDRTRLRARDERAGDDLEVVLGLGRGPGCAHDGRGRPRGPGHARTRARPPTTTPSTCSSGPSSASRARWRSISSASPCSTTGGPTPPGTLVDERRHAADASGAGQTVRLCSDLALGIEGGRVRARHVLAAGRARVLRALMGERAGRAARRGRARTRRSRRRSASGARGWIGPGSPTIASAIRSSARRSRSRA